MFYFFSVKEKVIFIFPKPYANILFFFFEADKAQEMCDEGINKPFIQTTQNSQKPTICHVQSNWHGGWHGIF